MRELLLGALLGISVTALATQAPAPAPEDQQSGLEKYRQALQDQLNATQPDTTSPGWKQLSDEVGLMLQTSRQGVPMGRLFVRDGAASWRAVAVEGFRDLAPYAVEPAGER